MGLEHGQRPREAEQCSQDAAAPGAPLRDTPALGGDVHLVLAPHVSLLGAGHPVGQDSGELSRQEEGLDVPQHNDDRSS